MQVVFLLLIIPLLVFAMKVKQSSTLKYLPESIGTLIPGQLSANGVGDGRDEFAAQAELGAQLDGEVFGTVVWVRHVPFELVDQ